MTYAGKARPALITISGMLATGWLLVACGDDGTTETENTTVETTETTTEPAETTEPTETTEGENTIEIPSPDMDAPEMPEVTTSPVP